MTEIYGDYLVLYHIEKSEYENVIGFVEDLFCKESIIFESDLSVIIRNNKINQQEAQQTLNSLMCDLNTKFIVFFANHVEEHNLKNYLTTITKYLNYNLKDIFYDEKQLIDEISFHSYEDVKGLILKEYSLDYDTQHMIKIFILNDMNVLKTAKQLYMHRNTLINRLDRFTSKTGYDPRKFKDAYLIYNLIK